MFGGVDRPLGRRGLQVLRVDPEEASPCLLQATFSSQRPLFLYQSLVISVQEVLDQGLL